MIAGIDDDMKWLDIVKDGNNDYGYFDFYNDLDIVAMGRKTFDISLELAGKNPYADKQVVIFSKTQKDSIHEGVEILYELGDIHKYKNKNIWIVGGGEIVSQLINSKLIDKLIISIIPIIIPDGVPLFTGIENDSLLELEECKNFDSGLVQLTYMVK
jgi:dihydrofolate reductase